jgi:MFS family permease
MPVSFFTQRGIYYGWVVIATMFATLFMVLGTRFSFGIFYVAILEDTGWQRAETAAIFSISMAVYALAMIVSGALFDRFGPRRLFPSAIVLLSLGLLLCSTIDTTWSFYLSYGVLVGFAFALLGFPTHMAVVPRWFVRRRGLAAAVALSGMGVGSLLITVLSDRLIAVIGWRGTFMVFAVAILAVLFPLNLLFHRNSPEEVGLHPDGGAAPPDAMPGTSLDGTTLLSALRAPAWWLLLISVSTIGFISMTMVVHMTRLSLDLGYAPATASLLFGMTGLTRSGGQLFWGMLSDRMGRTTVFITVTLLGIAGMAFLLLARTSPEFIYLLLFTILFGFGYMGISPVYASTVADLFPGRHLGKILSTLDIGFGAGASSGPWLAGYLFDRFGHYDFTLMMITVGMVVGAVTLYLASRYRYQIP